MLENKLIEHCSPALAGIVWQVQEVHRGLPESICKRQNPCSADSGCIKNSKGW